MLNRYRKYQEVQYMWIKKNPIKWLALNAILFVLFMIYIEYMDRKATRELFDNETPAG